MNANAAPDKHPHNPVVRYFRALGPGLVTGAADDDPSGVTTYAVAGAAFGTGMLWTAVVTLPLMAAVQLICARIGVVSGRGLAGAMRALSALVPLRGVRLAPDRQRLQYRR
jgi:Mn2+/Fe2+ NRAMP family transporter